jgi:hypothetical protein
MKRTVQTNGKIKKTNSADAKGQQGICRSCDNFALCNFIYPARQSVFFCEEYACSYAPAMANIVKRQPASKKGKAPLKSYKGLCATCENIGNCLYPKDEAGIWHCEEYR